MAKHFDVDPNFEEELLHSPFARDLVEELADRAAERARQIVPVESGDLRDSIEGDVVLDSRGFTGRVNAFDWKAHFVEFGTVRRRARPFIRPAVEAEVGPLHDA